MEQAHTRNHHENHYVAPRCWDCRGYVWVSSSCGCKKMAGGVFHKMMPHLFKPFLIFATVSVFIFSMVSTANTKTLSEISFQNGVYTAKLTYMPLKELTNINYTKGI